MVHIVVVNIKSPFNKQYTCSTVNLIIIETHNYCNRNSNSSTVQVVQYSTILYCTIYYTLQYCTALWYNVLCTTDCIVLDCMTSLYCPLICVLSLFYSQMSQFSEFIHEVANDLPCGHEVLPSTGTVFDYYLDLKTYRFFSWSEKKREKSTNATSKYISIPEVSQVWTGNGTGTRTVTRTGNGTWSEIF